MKVIFGFLTTVVLAGFQDVSCGSAFSVTTINETLGLWDTKANYTPDECECEGFIGSQFVVNRLADIGITHIVNSIQSENAGCMQIPDIDTDVLSASAQPSTEKSIHVAFRAQGGRFGDLTTLQRTKDTTLSHQNEKLIISSAIKLGWAELLFDKYQAQYGIIKVNGKLSATIDGVQLKGEVAADYNQRPCRMMMQSVEIIEFGKVDVKLTGLGPLNKVLSKIISGVTKYFRDDIVYNVENKLKEFVNKVISRYDCEHFRP